jgi:hypothetical protein
MLNGVAAGAGPSPRELGACPGSAVAENVRAMEPSRGNNERMGNLHLQAAATLGKECGGSHDLKSAIGSHETAPPKQ